MITVKDLYKSFGENGVLKGISETVEMCIRDSPQGGAGRLFCGGEVIKYSEKRALDGGGIVYTGKQRRERGKR